MLVTLNSFLLQTAFFLSLMAFGFSALFMLHPRIPLGFVRIHVVLCGLPPLVALLNLIADGATQQVGPWHLDRLAWLTALFVLTIGFVVQRYSVRHLLGDKNYRKYFALLTLTTGAASLAWLSGDLRLLLMCWGVTLLGLTLLIRLSKEWRVAKTVATRAGLLFAFSWLFFSIAVVSLAQMTGHWQLSLALSKGSLVHLHSWEKTGVDLLLVLAVVIPAAQIPFQRWLLDSVVVPTPVSAVMHAGVVNAGGIILTRFALIFNGDIAQLVLIILSSLSVLLGTGIILVQPDYKRQLVGSTMAQMGFMLIQCALGAYLAAIVHAVLHGLFKSALFLQAGSAVQHNEFPKHTIPLGWKTAGGLFGLAVGLGYWFLAKGTGYEMLSALLLGWSVALAWSQLVVVGLGRVGRILGFSLLIGALSAFSITLVTFYAILRGSVPQGIPPQLSVVIVVLLTLLGSSVMGVWVSRHPSSALYARVYLWLFRLGEPHLDSVESHPKYLVFRLMGGGN